MSRSVAVTFRHETPRYPDEPPVFVAEVNGSELFEVRCALPAAPDAGVLLDLLAHAMRRQLAKALGEALGEADRDWKAGGS